jgi:hypothetical protein
VPSIEATVVGSDAELAASIEYVKPTPATAAGQKMWLKSLLGNGFY